MKVIDYEKLIEEIQHQIEYLDLTPAEELEIVSSCLRNALIYEVDSVKFRLLTTGGKKMKAIIKVYSLSVASMVLAEHNVGGVRVSATCSNYSRIRFNVASWDELNRIVREINELGHGGCFIRRVKESKKRAVGAGSRG